MFEVQLDEVDAHAHAQRDLNNSALGRLLSSEQGLNADDDQAHAQTSQAGNGANSSTRGTRLGSSGFQRSSRSGSAMWE